VVRDCIFEGFKPVIANAVNYEAVAIDPAVTGAIPGIGAGALDGTSCANVLVNGCTVRGYSTATLGSYGCLAGSHFFTDADPSTEIQILGNYAEDMDYYVVHAYNWENVVVQGNVVEFSNGGVLFEVPSTVSTQLDLSGITVQGNIFRSMGKLNDGTVVADAVIAIYGLDATTSIPCREAVVNGNSIKGLDTGTGIIFNNVADVICSNNVVCATTSAAQVGIRASGSYCATIQGNKLTGGLTSGSIWVENGGASTVSDSAIISNNNLNAVGTLVIDSAWCNLIGNIINNPAGTSYAVIITANGTNTVVTGNNIRKSSGSSLAGINTASASVWIQANNIFGYGTTDGTNGPVRRNGVTLSPNTSTTGNSTTNLNRYT
jgi:hypothetical protein